MAESNEIVDLMNEQIKAAIDLSTYISALFRNPNMDSSKIGVTSESDFYLGAMWASALDFIAAKIMKRYGRVPTRSEQVLAVKTIYEHASEFKQAIRNLGL